MFILCEKKYVKCNRNFIVVKPSIYLSLIAILLSSYQFKFNYFCNNISNNFILTLLYSCLCGKTQVHNRDCFFKLMEENDWKPLIIGVTQLWKLETNAKMLSKIFTSLC